MWLKKLKILFHGYIISDLNVEEVVGTFYEKELQKNYIRVEKVNVANNMLNGKAMIILLTVGLIKNIVM